MQRSLEYESFSNRRDSAFLLAAMVAITLLLARAAPAEEADAAATAPSEVALADVDVSEAAVDILSGGIDEEHDGRTFRRNEGEENEFAFYAAGPRNATRHVVLFHTAFGLNDRIRSTADALGQLGLRVWAIDLFNGRSTGSLIRGYWLLSEANDEVERTRGRIRAALQWLERGVGDEPVVVLGFSFGARWAAEAMVLRPDLIDSAVLFYPYPLEDVAALNAQLAEAGPILAIFSTDDEYVEPGPAAEWRKDMHDRDADLRELVLTGGGHAFMHPELENFDEALVKRAWREVVAFLQVTFGGEAIEPAPAP